MAALKHRSRTIHEPVAVPSKLNNFFPKAFVWRGQRHEISAVESCRTEVRRDWRGQAQRHRFQVRTAAGLVELIQDLVGDTWQIERMWARKDGSS